MKKQNSWSGRRAVRLTRSEIHPAFFKDLLRLEVPTHEEALAYCRVVQAAVRRILGIGSGVKPDFEGVKHRDLIKRLRKSERAAFDQIREDNPPQFSVAPRFENPLKI